jgi:uncharacterized protein (UPF0371 family)
MDIFRNLGFLAESVVVTHYTGQPAADAYCKRLANMGIKTYKHFIIENYPYDVATIVSDDGFGKNEFAETSRPLVIVTAPGPGSGKLATCMSQIYGEHMRGRTAGYAKFETFPIWNIPLKHPVNLAYEAATVDLDDVNMIDPFHLEAHGETTVNYNRDVEAFPVLRAMLTKILGESPYQSPTDMGVNMAGYAIADDAAVREAANLEIWRRYFQTANIILKTGAGEQMLTKMESIMSAGDVTLDQCPARSAALLKEEATGAPAAAMVLPDGSIVTGKTSSLMGAASSLLMNALKELAGIDPEELLISEEAIQPICDLKTEHLGSHNPRLHSDETLIALSISSTTSELAKSALEQLPKLRGCDAFFSVITSSADEKLYKRLGVNVSSEPKYERHSLYHR